MPAPSTADEFLDLIRKSGVVEEGRISAYVDQLNSTSGIPTDMSKFAGLFVRDGLLTYFQAEQFLLGKWKRFTIGKYKVLERIGSGGMGQVFLCEHKLMRRKVAVKVLPTAKAEDPSSLERFYREARAVAALDHPNIVRAYDIDQDDNLHFLVMEYVDGASLQDMVKKHGPMDITRACHYIYGSAIGLQHAHEAGLIHRDIKPGNILIDRQGTVKILDMGLARFFNDDEDMLTKKYDENVLGTADYLAPEQAVDSHGVDGRADIYSLGATFYFMLAGHQPFIDGTVAQKLIWHQTRSPKPIRDLRADVPEGVVAILEKMMAKEADHRYQSPAELAEALQPWVQTPISPPPDKEMPVLSAAAQAVGGTGPATTVTRSQPIPLHKLTGGSTTKGAGSAARKPDSGKSGGSGLPPASRTKKSGQMPVIDSEQTKRRSGPSPTIESLPPSSEPAVWESLSADTNDAARDQTKRQPNSPSRRRNKVEPDSLPDTDLEPKRRTTKRSLMVPLVIILLLILAGGSSFAVYWFVIRNTDQPAPPGGPPVQNDGIRLTVSKAGGGGQYTTVREALDKAKDGQHIVIMDSAWDEELTTPSRDWKGIVIEGEDGKNVVWKLPEGKSALKTILLQNAENLTIRNVHVEGNTKTEVGILVTGKSNGLVIEDLTIKDMIKAGIQFADCLGGDNPVILQRSRIVGNKANPLSDAAVLFAATAEKTVLNRNESVTIRDCRIEGNFRKGAITFSGGAIKIEIRLNRLWQATKGTSQSNGIYFDSDNKTPYDYRMKIVNNTFHSFESAGIRFKNANIYLVQKKDKNLNIEVELNYFFNVKELMKADDKNVMALTLTPPPLDNARNKASKEGLPIAAVEVEGVLGVNPEDDKTFLRYTRQSSLNKVPPFGKPVGVPPE